MIYLVVAAACALAPILLLALRRPALRRLAVRNAAGRPTEALLVVLGCALGTAIITGSLLVGDTLDTSLRDRAPERLGPADVVVSSFAAPVADAIETSLISDPPRGTDGILPMTVVEATLATPDAAPGGRKVLPNARLLETDFERARNFGGDASATGISGPQPAPDEVVLGRDAAERLGVGAGDSVEAYAYGQYSLFRVDRVLPRTGVAGYATEFDDASLNAFVTPGTVATLAAGAGITENSRPPERLVLVSAEGGVFGGAVRTDEVVGALRERLSTLVGFEIRPAKRDLLEIAAEEGSGFAELFLSLGAFAILAGAALLANVLVMLAEGRRGELGVLRALGLSRREMVGAFVLEGAVYAVAASALGALAGVAVARGVVFLAGGVFSSAQRGGVEALRFGFEPATLVIGAIGGLLVSLAVVFASSLWIGRMTVVEAMEDSVRRPERTPPRWYVAALLSLGVVFSGASAISVAVGADVGSLLLPCLALAAFAAAGRASPTVRVPEAALVDGTAVAAMIWAVVAFPILDLDADEVVPFVAQGLVLALGAVVLVVRRQAWAGGVLGRFGGGLALRVATAYPSAHPVRTGTTLLAYGLIVFTLVFSAVLSGVFSGQKEQLVRDEAGGFDLLVSTSPADPVPTDELRNAEGVEATAPLAWTVAGFRVGSTGPFREWAISGFDEDLLAGGPPALETFDRGRYPNEAAVWEAVSQNPKLAIADVAFLQRGGGPPESNVAVGQEIEIEDLTTGERVGREVVAVSAAGAAFSGVMVSLESFDDLVGEPVLNRHYVAVSGDPGGVATELQRTYLANGLEARPFAEIVDGVLRDQEEFFDLIEAFLAFGLLIGTGGLGVVMARAARERRRQVGVLKALGFSPSAVRAAFLVESGLVALEGTLIGASLALVTSYQLVTFTTAFGDAGADFFVPWTQLVLLPAGVLAASLLASLPSALRASSDPPAAVLRAAEEAA